jgi:D-alanyl-D-alanine dipeptidase
MKNIADIIFIADESVTSIPIIDCAEDILDIKNQSEIAFGLPPEIPDNSDYTKMRITIYNKLREAQSRLPHGLKLKLYEGYRSIELQEKLFNMRFKILKRLNSNWSDDEVFKETTRMVSPVNNKDGSKNIPPHSTGAAVDVYLVNHNGEIIDMGMEVKDWPQDVDGELSQTNSNQVSETAIIYRRIMAEALHSVGFVNYPMEYWHWSYGDRYWAFLAHKPYAIYGIV